MKTLKALIVFAILSMTFQSFAAINCRPGMNNCPGTPGGGGPRPR